MAGTHKRGFPGDTPVADAKGEALAWLRAPLDEGGLDDQDEVTAGPDVVQTDAHAEAGEYLIRIVTGVPDPRAEAEALVAARPPLDPVHGVLARLADLPPDKFAKLMAALDRVEG